MKDFDRRRIPTRGLEAVLLPKELKANLDKIVHHEKVSKLITMMFCWIVSWSEFSSIYARVYIVPAESTSKVSLQFYVCLLGVMHTPHRVAAQGILD